MNKKLGKIVQFVKQHRREITVATLVVGVVSTKTVFAAAPPEMPTSFTMSATLDTLLTNAAKYLVDVGDKMLAYAAPTSLTIWAAKTVASRTLQSGKSAVARRIHV